jgi:RNA polymerase sigma factor (sigma-70 family)
VGLRREIEAEQLRTRLESLTNREREVMLLVAEGLTNREIGERLEISPRTVETHRERVMSKLRVRSVAELTRFVVEHGLDAPDPQAGGP